MSERDVIDSCDMLYIDGISLVLSLYTFAATSITLSLTECPKAPPQQGTNFQLVNLSLHTPYDTTIIDCRYRQIFLYKSTTAGRVKFTHLRVTATVNQRESMISAPL